MSIIEEQVTKILQLHESCSQRIGVGIVGPSGCGKSTTGRSILQLNDPTEGEVIFNGENIANWNVNQMRPLRRQMQLIFQGFFDHPLQ